MNLSVVIPVYNEVKNIGEIIRRVQSTKLALEIIVVDDGSKDGTRDALQKLAEPNKVRVILHERNQGKGAAVVTGLRAAAGDILLIQDADLEYDPRDYPALLQPIEEGLPLTRECAHFIDCIASGTAPRTPVSEGLAVMRILTAGMVRHKH